MPKKAKRERLEDMIPCIGLSAGLCGKYVLQENRYVADKPFLGHDAEPLKQAETPEEDHW